MIVSGGVVPVPVPVSGTVCGLPAALSVTFSVAVRVPVAEGLKTTDMVQLVPGVSVRPAQASSVLKSRPAWLIDTPLMNRFASPVLVTVTDCGALVVPTACEPNVSEVGVNVTAGAAALAGAARAPTITRAPTAASETGINDDNRRSRIL